MSYRFQLARPPYAPSAAQLETAARSVSYLRERNRIQAYHLLPMLRRYREADELTRFHLRVGPAAKRVRALPQPPGPQQLVETQKIRTPEWRAPEGVEVPEELRRDAARSRDARDGVGWISAAITAATTLYSAHRSKREGEKARDFAREQAKKELRALREQRDAQLKALALKKKIAETQAQSGAAAAAVPGWIWPVAIGGGVLLLAQLGGKRR